MSTTFKQRGTSVTVTTDSELSGKRRAPLSQRGPAQLSQKSLAPRTTAAAPGPTDRVTHRVLKSIVVLRHCSEPPRTIRRHPPPSLTWSQFLQEVNLFISFSDIKTLSFLHLLTTPFSSLFKEKPKPTTHIHKKYFPPSIWCPGPNIWSVFPDWKHSEHASHSDAACMLMCMW